MTINDAPDESVEERAQRLSIDNPLVAEFFGGGTPNFSGVHVGQSEALSIAAVWRAVALISQTLASLPSGVIETDDDGMTRSVSSWVDNPAGPEGQTSFEFWESIYAHLLIHGNAFCLITYNAGGGVAYLKTLHPSGVSIEVDMFGQKTFVISSTEGIVRLSSRHILHIPGLSFDGIRGLSPIAVARNSLGTAIAGERSAANMFAKGPLLAGLVTPDYEDMTPEDSTAIKEMIDRKMTGWERSGEVAVVNRRLKFEPWSMTMADAQFLESRQFQIEEVARWFGVPPFALMQTEKATSWGTGIESQQRGLSRQVLLPWASRVEGRIGRLLAPRRKHRFDFTGLERPTPEQEIGLIIAQYKAGLLTTNEARAMRHLPPIAGEDQLLPPNLTVNANVDDIDEAAETEGFIEQ